MSEQLNALKVLVQETQKRLKEEGKSAVLAGIREFLEKYPEVANVNWTQYTPYFNDGNACEFRVNTMQLAFVDGKSARPHLKSTNWFQVDKMDDDELTEELENDREVIYYLKDGAFNDAVTELSESLQAVEEALEFAFGDHVQITVTRTDVEIEGYDHD